MTRTDLMYVTVPIDPETLEPQEESVFMEAFGGHLFGCTLGFVGLEHLEHLFDMTDLMVQLRDTLQPQVTAAALQREIQFLRQNPRRWAPGEIPHVRVPVLVPRYTMDAVVARLYPDLGVNWRSIPPPSPQPQFRVVRPEAPAPKAQAVTVQWWRPAPRLVPRFAW
jgi:hypothetical protein